MRPHGVIYKRGVFSQNRGEVRFALPFKLKVFYNYLYFWGNCFFVASFAILIFSFSPIIFEEAKYQFRSSSLIEKNSDSSNSSIGSISADEISSVEKETTELGIDDDFSLTIPKIDASSRIIANVDTGNQVEYMEALSKGVAHAKGTYFPGQGRPIFLFAHSTNASINIGRYNAVFYLLSKLEKGDRVTTYFAGKKYEYEVIETAIKNKNDTSFLYDQSGEEKLYLMTCTPPGTTWKRLFVIAKPVV